ncbi:MAG: insulinase family protein [Bacteroidia bacterium]
MKLNIALALSLTVCSTTQAQTIRTYGATDPLKVETFTLANGLKVIVSNNKAEPRIQCAIAVKAGSKNDPADATGLAHYLEHMLFKGTDKFGTANFATEQVQLQVIENLYETYRATRNETERKAIYHAIDSVSGLAAQSSIANEFDKMMSGIGAQGNNAYTSNERTVYFEDIPSNQLSNWVNIQYERFRNPQMRIFHTELEAVYEEKNIGLDNDQNKQFEMMYYELFKNHNYGKQTTIGTIEHLKNPSIKKIKNYYNTYYVPNNMGIILSGDVNTAELIPLLNATFGTFLMARVPVYSFAPEAPILKPIIKNVYGQDPASVLIGFRCGNVTSADQPYLQLLSAMLSNGTAGLMDINLIQKQKVLQAFVYADAMKDYSTLFIGGMPKEKQTLQQLSALLLAQLNDVKKGKFEDWMIAACVNNAKVQFVQAFTKNANRNEFLVDVFGTESDYMQRITMLDEAKKITKQQLMDFVAKNFTTNYVQVNKIQAEDKNTPKVAKPIITPVATNSDKVSDFCAKVLAFNPPALTPKFVDFNKDVEYVNLRNSQQLWHVSNTTNNLFDFSLIINKGSVHDKKLEMAIAYLSLLGSNAFSAEKLKQEFFKIGCTYSLEVSDDATEIAVSGLNENFDAAINLLTNSIFNPKADELTLNNVKQDVLKTRTDAINDKDFIFQQAMRNYGLYGKQSPFNNILTNAELSKVTSAELLESISFMLASPYHAQYYGATNANDVRTILDKYFSYKSVTTLSPAPKVGFDYAPITDNEVIVYDFKDMQQAEFSVFTLGDSTLPNEYGQYKLTNDYYGGGMASVVFQTIRESKALAYSTRFKYGRKNNWNKTNVTEAYVGTQADKLDDALTAMLELTNTMSKNQIAFDASKNSIKRTIQSERIEGEDILNYVNSSKKSGLASDVREQQYTTIDATDMDKTNAYFNAHIANKKHRIVIVGDKSRIDLSKLSKYGTVKFVTKGDIIGF